MSVSHGGGGPDVGNSQLGGTLDEGKNNELLIEEKNKLEEEIINISNELKDKNEKILELLDEIEELKIQVFARDKSVELQQKQI